MHPQEKKLVAALLEMASDRFSNHGCNDLPKELRELFSKEEWVALDRAHHERNGDPQEHNPENPDIMRHDWLLMSHFAHILREEAECPTTKPSKNV